MITGFEEQTCDLNDHEKDNVVPEVIKILKGRTKDRPVTNAQMVHSLQRIGIGTSEPRIRKVINYLRTQAIVPGICSTSNGYYVASNEQELVDYIKSLTERANSILAVIKALEAQKDQFTNRAPTLF